MNIKLKAFLLALVYVATPFVFLYIAFMYPLVILVVAVALIVWLIYNKVLAVLENEYRKKNGYSIKEFDETFGGPQ